MVREEVSSGIFSSCADSMAASTADLPSPISTMIDSDMTMALSTNMPKAIIMAAKDIWSMPIPSRPITSKAMIMAIGIKLDTAKPVRRPRNTSITASTMTIACSRLVTNSSTLRLTCSG